MQLIYSRVQWWACVVLAGMLPGAIKIPDIAFFAGILDCMSVVIVFQA